MTFAQCVQHLLDALFPKEPIIEAFEKLKSSALLKHLPQIKRTASTNWIRSIFQYHHPWTEKLIKELKYYRNPNIAQTFAEIIENEMHQAAFGQDFIIIPIPPRKQRLKTYGYDQNDFLLSFLTEELRRRVRSDLLIRAKQTGSFSQLTRSQRKNQSHNLFELKHTSPLPNHIVLYDDVTTTHATLEAARLCFVENGTPQESISAITLAQSGD